MLIRKCVGIFKTDDLSLSKLLSNKTDSEAFAQKMRKK